jgi:hypothetical protein
MHIFTHKPNTNYVLKQIGPSETNAQKLFWQQTLKINIYPVGIAPTQKP